MEEPRLQVIFREEFDLERYVAALFELARTKSRERASQATKREADGE